MVDAIMLPSTTSLIADVQKREEKGSETAAINRQKKVGKMVGFGVFCLDLTEIIRRF